MLENSNNICELFAMVTVLFLLLFVLDRRQLTGSVLRPPTRTGARRSACLSLLASPALLRSSLTEQHAESRESRHDASARRSTAGENSICRASWGETLELFAYVLHYAFIFLWLSLFSRIPLTFCFISPHPTPE
jgi:hypothetical protein